MPLRFQIKTPRVVGLGQACESMDESPDASVSSKDFSPHAPGLITDGRLLEEGSKGIDERCVRRLARATDASEGFLDAVDGLEVQALVDHYCMLVTVRKLWVQKKGLHSLTAVLRIIKHRLGITKIGTEELFTHSRGGKDLTKAEQLLMLGTYLYSALSQAGVCAYSPGYWGVEVGVQERKEGNDYACCALGVTGLYFVVGAQPTAQQEAQEPLSAEEAGLGDEEEEEEEEEGEEAAAPKASKRAEPPKASTPTPRKKKKENATPATPARRKYPLNMMLRYVAMLKAPALSAWVKPLSQCSDRGDLLAKRLHLFATSELLALYMTGKPEDFGGFLSGVDAAALGENVQGWDVPPDSGLFDQAWFTCAHRRVVAALTSVVRRLNAKPPPKPSGKAREESGADVTTWGSVAAVLTEMREQEKAKGFTFTDRDLGAVLFFIYQGEESTSVMSTLLRKLSDAEVFEAGGEKNGELRTLSPSASHRVGAPRWRTALCILDLRITRVVHHP